MTDAQSDSLDLSIVSGWHAQVWIYAVSFRSLWIRFYQSQPGDFDGSRFLYCSGCKSVPQLTDWQVEKLEAERFQEPYEHYVISDRAGGISFACSTVNWTKMPKKISCYGLDCGL